MASGTAAGVGYDSVLVDIVGYVYHYHPKSDKALRNARLAFLDALGCVCETLTSKSDVLRLIGPMIPGTSTSPGFHLPGTALELDPVKGAFDLGVLIRYLDHNDAFSGAEWGHPSDNLAAILAIADWAGRSPMSLRPVTAPPLTIETVLVGLIKAYEIQGCFQIRNAFNSVGLDHVILVKVASTAIVSWLLGLSEQEALAALSHAWLDGHPLRVYRQAPNAGPRKGWAAGNAAMQAIQTVLITRCGQPGAPSVLTAKKWGFYDAVFKGKQFDLPLPYSEWVMENILFKLVPAEGHALTAIEAMLVLANRLKERGINACEDIAGIVVRTHSSACLIINKVGRLRNPADRDHCMQYMLAVALLKQAPPEYSDYEDQSPWALDVRVDQLRERMVLVEDAAFTSDYYDISIKSMASGVSVELTDGTTMAEVVVRYPLGAAQHPDTIRAVGTKISKNLGLLFDAQQVDKITLAVHNEPSMAIKDFVDMMWKGRKPALAGEDEFSVGFQSNV